MINIPIISVVLRKVAAHKNRDKDGIAVFHWYGKLTSNVDGFFMRSFLIKIIIIAWR